jgi:CBS domain-containing protein
LNRAAWTGAERAPLSGASVRDAMLRRPKLLGPAATIAQVRELFHDDHVHVALLVDRGKLLAVVEPSDLIDALPASSPAVTVGRLQGRVTRPDADLVATWETMTAHGRRRLAVIDGDGNCLGLLCLKRSGLGFCSEADVRSRAHESSNGGGSAAAG